MAVSSALYFAAAAGSFHASDLGDVPNSDTGFAAPYVYAASEVTLSAGMPLLLANGGGRPDRRKVAGGAILTCAGVTAMVARISSRCWATQRSPSGCRFSSTASARSASRCEMEPFVV